MLVVDSHVHLGNCRVFDSHHTIETIKSPMEKYNIDISIVQPFAGVEDPVQVHNTIARLSREYPGKFYGIVSISPHIDVKEFIKEVRRCINELDFVGIKLHTLGHAVHPLSKDADRLFELAQELGVPVMVHTGAGIPFAAPALLIERAEQYPELPIILSHAGGGISTGEAFVVARRFPNVYLEPSWCATEDIKRMINEFGVNRILFGADIPSNIPVELQKYRSLELDDRALAGCLGKTAVDLFDLAL